MISLAACNRGVPSNDAVRQGVLDHLNESQAKTGLNLANMDVAIKSVQFSGSDEADAAVEINAKGAAPGGGMSISYHLKQQGSKWVVVGRQDSHGAMAPGQNPHGGAMPDAPNPHGDATMAAPGGAGGKMPSPDDLPPTGKKK